MLKEGINFKSINQSTLKKLITSKSKISHWKNREEVNTRHGKEME
jgi:hypothetical protein